MSMKAVSTLWGLKLDEHRVVKEMGHRWHVISATVQFILVWWRQSERLRVFEPLNRGRVCSRVIGITNNAVKDQRPITSHHCICRLHRQTKLDKTSYNVTNRCQLTL